MAIFRSCGSSKTLRDQFNLVRDEIAANRAAIIGIAAKLDADAGVTGTNYEALWSPAAMTSEDLTEN